MGWVSILRYRLRIPIRFRVFCSSGGEHPNHKKCSANPLPVSDPRSPAIVLSPMYSHRFKHSSPVPARPANIRRNFQSLAMYQRSPGNRRPACDRKHSPVHLTHRSDLARLPCQAIAPYRQASREPLASHSPSWRTSALHPLSIHDVILTNETSVCQAGVCQGDSQP